MVISLPEWPPPAKSCVAAGWWQQPVATLHLHDHDARILGEIWVRNYLKTLNIHNMLW